MYLSMTYLYVLCVCGPSLSSTSAVGAGQCLRSNRRQNLLKPLLDIVWCRPDTNSGKLLLELATQEELHQLLCTRIDRSQAT